MRPSIRLGRIFGIEIGLHYSWFLIALLIVLSLSGHFQVVNPQWSTAVRWSLAAITGLLFFASILAHEMSHALIAKSRGIPVRSITLFALGGVANMEKDSSDARSEFWMAIAGPIASVLVGLFFLGVARAAGWHPGSGTPPSPLGAGLVWLGYINVALAAFNMIPGYPLDGGRVLRAIIWGINRNLVRATKLSADVGQVIAIAFIAFGFSRFFFSGAFGGLWLAFIGWFLSDAAAASRATAEVSVALENVRVGDVMSRDCPPVDGYVNLQNFAEEFLMRTGRRSFVVLQNGRQWGLMTINQLKEVDRNRWAFTTIADVALPLDQLRAVSPDTSVTTALQLMATENVSQLPVISNGEFVGVIGRGNIVQFMETQQELKAA